MKKVTFMLTVLPLVVALFLGGCADMLMEQPNVPELAEGEGLLVISLAGANVGAGSALTMLPMDPQFTRYELEYTVGSISFYSSNFQLALEDGTYNFIVNGYAGDKIVAKSDPTSVNIPAGGITPITFILKPDMNTTDPGVLDFSLNWDGLSRMPYRAELQIEQYGAGETFIPLEIPLEYRSGSVPGSIQLLDSESAFVNLTGSLTLPSGEYRLTMSVTMDKGDTTPARRLDLAHVYSNLTTPAPFYYGGGDLYISNTSPDSGVSFITGFTFDETPNATTVIGSEPGLDGTRMIMIMVPSTADLTALTPIVTTAEGTVITSPQMDRGATSYLAMDFTGPMIWTAQAKNGAVQKYTVVVSDAPDNSTDKRITYFFFENYGNNPGIIDEAGHTIQVILPTGTPVTAPDLNPIISIIGKSVVRYESGDYAVGPFDFTGHSSTGTPVVYRVYAENNSHQDYDVTVDVAPDNTAVITQFSIDGYPDRFGAITTDSPYDKITVTLPYGVSLKNLTPVIQYQGKTLDPASGTAQNFSGSVQYTVTAQNPLITKTYTVTVINDKPDQNTGIFDFRITNVPTAKVVIGQKPRQDGKIPIVIQIPYYPPADNIENNLIPAITLSNPNAKIYPINDSAASASGIKIPFGNAGNPKEAVYRVESHDDSTIYQDYVAVVSMSGQYYYVDGKNGRDDWPDYYNGETEGRAFKTLAHAVEEASNNSDINKIFLMGDLTAAAGGNSTATSEGSFVLDFGKTAPPANPITITSTTGAVIRGDGTKRVLAIKGAANLVFENISVIGGNANGTNAGTNNDGGGIYVTGNSKVKFSGGSITGNTARNGGGVYVEAGAGASDYSEFTFMSGTISGNTATGAVADNAAGWEANPLSSSKMGGGGGVYVNGKALFWLASGTISGNTSKGAGGGVLVNGTVEKDGGGNITTEYGLLMSGGTISANTTTSQTYPHGGGGVYVAHGAFDMEDGSVTGNNATRQGGGVFIHWGDARFTAAGNSSITGNEGVGSSKAICNRGTAAMTDNARADKVYIWDYDEDNYILATDPKQSFTLAKGAQVSGLVLAYSAHDESFVTIAEAADSWDGPMCTIDLESRLINGLLHGPISDWYGHKVISGNNTALEDLITGSRLPLNTFTGSPSLSNLENNYRIVVNGIFGKFQTRP